MTEDELIDMIKNNSSYELSKQDIEYLCLQRRRHSIDLKQDQTPIQRSSTPVFKVMILGDESEHNGKLQFYDTLIDNTSKIPYPITNVQLQTNQNSLFQLWVPYCTDLYSNLRFLYYEYTHIFVMFFNIAQRESFNYLKDELLPEVTSFIDNLKKKSSIIPPILLVGYQSESREIHGAEDVISFEEIVEVAQFFKCSKYIEIQSKEYHKQRERHHSHVYEVMEHVSNMMKQELFNLSIQHFEWNEEYFKSMLTVPTPEISFHQMEKTFLISEFIEDVDYFYTMDGSYPKSSQCIPIIDREKQTLHSSSTLKYEKPITIHSQKIHQIHVVGIERCKYTSDIATFTIPNESESVNGYFDVLSKCFRITNWKKDCIYYYTLDGSIPTEHFSHKCMESQIDLDVSLQQQHSYSQHAVSSSQSGGHSGGGQSNTTTLNVESPHPPTCNNLSIIAVEKGKLKSSIRSFIIPPTLQLPNVKYDAIDSTFTIDTVPGVVYRYTLDGSIPTHPFDSNNNNSSNTTFTYTRSVMLPKKESVKCIKVIGYPKLSFPSACVEIQAKPLMQEHLSSPSSQVKLNNTALKRMKNHSSPPTTSSTINTNTTNTINTTTSTNTTLFPSTTSATSATNNSMTTNHHHSMTTHKSSPRSDKSTTATTVIPKKKEMTETTTTSTINSAVSTPLVQIEEEKTSSRNKKNTPPLHNGSLNMLLSNYNSPSTFISRSDKHDTTSDSPFNDEFSLHSKNHPSMQKTVPVDNTNAQLNLDHIQRSANESSGHYHHLENSHDMTQQYHQHPLTPRQQQSTSSKTPKFLKTSTTNDFKVQCKAEGSNVIFSFDRQVSVKRIRITTPGSRKGPQFYACYVPMQTNHARSIKMKVGEGELQDIDSIQYLDLFKDQVDGAIVCKELICTFSPFEGQRSFKIVDMKIECNKLS